MIYPYRDPCRDRSFTMAHNNHGEYIYNNTENNGVWTHNDKHPKSINTADTHSPHGYDTLGGTGEERERKKIKYPSEILMNEDAHRKFDIQQDKEIEEWEDSNQKSRTINITLLSCPKTGWKIKSTETEYPPREPYLSNSDNRNRCPDTGPPIKKFKEMSKSELPTSNAKETSYKDISSQYSNEEDQLYIKNKPKDDKKWNDGNQKSSDQLDENVFNRFLEQNISSDIQRKYDMTKVKGICRKLARGRTRDEKDLYKNFFKNLIEILTGDKDIKYFKCKVKDCVHDPPNNGKGWSTKQKVEEHIQYIHLSIFYECQYCDKKLNRQDQKKEHERNVHECKYCDKKFNKQDQKKEHERNEHGVEKKSAKKTTNGQRSNVTPQKHRAAETVGQNQLINIGRDPIPRIVNTNECSSIKNSYVEKNQVQVPSYKQQQIPPDANKQQHQRRTEAITTNFQQPISCKKIYDSNRGRPVNYPNQQAHIDHLPGSVHTAGYESGMNDHVRHNQEQQPVYVATMSYELQTEIPPVVDRKDSSKIWCAYKKINGQPQMLSGHGYDANIGRSLNSTGHQQTVGQIPGTVNANGYESGMNSHVEYNQVHLPSYENQ